MIEEKENELKTYLEKIGLKCGVDIFQSDSISSEACDILDKVLTIIFGENYYLE